MDHAQREDAHLDIMQRRLKRVLLRIFLLIEAELFL